MVVHLKSTQSLSSKCPSHKSEYYWTFHLIITWAFGEDIITNSNANPCFASTTSLLDLMRLQHSYPSRIRTPNTRTIGERVNHGLRRKQWTWKSSCVSARDIPPAPHILPDSVRLGVPLSWQEGDTPRCCSGVQTWKLRLVWFPFYGSFLLDSRSAFHNFSKWYKSQDLFHVTQLLFSYPYCRIITLFALYHLSFIIIVHFLWSVELISSIFTLYFLHRSSYTKPLVINSVAPVADRQEQYNEPLDRVVQFFEQYLSTDGNLVTLLLKILLS